MQKAWRLCEVSRLKEVRIYYSSPLVVIMNDPFNGDTPTLVLRQVGDPTKETWKEIRRVLKLCKMELVKTSYIRKDGLFCQPVKEVSDGEELLDSVYRRKGD